MQAESLSVPRSFACGLEDGPRVGLKVVPVRDDTDSGWLEVAGRARVVSLYDLRVLLFLCESTNRFGTKRTYPT